MTKRCALYLRVSTEQQVDGNSLTTQKSLLLRHAKARGYAVADIYVDAGLSGMNMNRPELQRLIADAQRQRFDLVLAWKVDRVSRSVKDLLDLVAVLREHGVEFAAVDQQFDTSDPVGVLTLHILGSFAQFEREMLVERTKEGQMHRLHRQDWSCGPVPYGYRKENGCLVEVPEEAKVVRRMFEMFLQLKGRRVVALRLNDEGLRTRRGAFWTCATVTEILRNPVYTGANVYGRRRKNDFHLRDAQDWTVVDGMRDAMVAPDMFQTAQALIAASQEGLAEKRAPEAYSLKGRVRCGKCGSAMCGRSLHRNGKVYRYYRCNGNQHRGRLLCSGMSADADILEKAVMEKVRGLAWNSAPAQTDAQDASETETEERKETRRALDRVRERTARLFDLYELGQLDRALFQERMAGLSEERDRLAAALKASARRDGDRVMAESDTAVNGVVKIVVQGKSAEVHVVDGGALYVSLLPECDKSTFGGRLRSWRLREGLMQRDLAGILDVDVCSVRNWECDRTAPRGVVRRALHRLVGGHGSHEDGPDIPTLSALLSPSPARLRRRHNELETVAGVR